MAAKNQRVQAIRAFRVRGEDVGEGSVLDLELPIARELRGARKVEFVPSDTKVVLLPLKKKERSPSAENQQIAALSAQVAVLTALVEKLTASAKGKEKVNA